MKIDYTKFLENKQEIANVDLKKEHFPLIVGAIKELDIHGHISIKWFVDNAAIYLDGSYINSWNYGTKSLFSGFVGDYN